MTKKVLILIVLLLTLGAESLCPDDPYAMAHFAKEWNIYVKKLANGERPLEQWRKVVRAWNKL